MNRRVNRVLSLALTIVLLIGILPNISFAATTLFFIRNNYTPDAYMYEADGVLRYGIPTAGDKSFQWEVEENGTHKTLKNVATNHYITLKEHAADTVEGYWFDAVKCLEWEAGNDAFLWDFTTSKSQNITSPSESYAGFALHVEGVTNGQVCGQNIGSDQLQWGNMQWDFVTAEAINFSAMSRDGFCIANAESGTYLRVDKGVLTYGKPDGPDNAYIWEIEDLKDGTKAIKNKLTSEYLSMTDFDKSSYTLGCTDLVTGDESFSWKFQISKETTILSASSDYEGYGLYLESISKGKAQCGELLSVTDYPLLGMKWNFIAASEVAEVAGPLTVDDGVYNLKNSWYAMYLIEVDGLPVYGNVKPTDIYAQWRMIYDEETGMTAIKNEGTGHYLHLSKDTEALVCNDSEVYYWILKRNKNSQYPNAVMFEDSQYADRYLHMESLNGFIEDSNAVQPTWGTPHWEPIKFDPNNEGSPSENSLMVPTGYIRLQSSSNLGEYLYENSAGAIVYGVCVETDARSHWEIIESDAGGGYYLKNRESSRIITNKGNGTLRGMTVEEGSSEGSLWEVSAGKEANGLLFNNAYSEMKPYLRPYINIQKASGFAQSNLVSIEEDTTQWIYEVALEETAAVAEQEEIAVPIQVYMDTNVYQIIYKGEIAQNLYQLEYYGDKIRLMDLTTNQYLYTIDGWQTKELKDNSDSSLLWEISTKAGLTILEQGDIKIQIEKVTSNVIYEAEDAFIQGDKSLFTVYAHEVGMYRVSIGYSGSKTSIDIGVNGIPQGSMTLPIKEGIELPLNKGVNTISLSKGSGVSEITVANSMNKNYRGASVTYTEYQAEDCATNGTLLEDDRTYHEISSEASGRSGATLSGTGQYVKFALTKPANAMVLRYAMPDSAEGTGLEETLNLYINGIKTKSIELTSKYSWVYGSYPWTNNPADGMPHRFFDESRIVFDQTYPAGTVIKLQKDSANHAEYYVLDVAELEEVPVASEMPENALSITEFGAKADDGQDDSKAFSDCLAAATLQGKEVWLPVGVFELNMPTSDYDAGDKKNNDRGIVLTKDNVVIRGAGMWHSVLTGEYAAFFIKASNISLYDFSLRGMATSRRDAIDPSAIETDYNTENMENMIVQNIWIQHYKTGIWTHNMSGLQVVGCRIRDTFADGMNLRRGTSNAVVEQCDVRNTGDDGIAQWSSEYSDTNNTIRFNTVSLPWLANNIALYGGTDIKIVDNLLKDTVAFGAGVNISTNFKPEPFAGTITVARNTFERCGAHDYNYNHDNGAIWFNTVKGLDNRAQVIVKDNLILDSTFQGISFLNGGTIDNVTLEGNVIDGCGSYGIYSALEAKGIVLMKNNRIQNVMLKDIYNGAGETFVITTEITKEIQITGTPEKGFKDTWVMLLVIPSMLALLVYIVFWRKKHHRK